MLEHINLARWVLVNMLCQLSEAIRPLTPHRTFTLLTFFMSFLCSNVLMTLLTTA